MTNRLKTVALALMAFATIASTASIALAKGAGPPPRHKLSPHSTPDLECRVHDADFWVINWGNTVVDSGRQIEWRSPTTGDDGVILLPKMLGPGEEVKLADLLSDFTLPGAPCSARFA